MVTGGTDAPILLALLGNSEADEQLSRAAIERAVARGMTHELAR